MYPLRIENISAHHSGPIGLDPFSPSGHLTLSQINQAHRNRWPDFISELGSHVGYNFVIFPDGTRVQTRKVGEETAAQIGHNFDTISFCLLGNFTLKASGSPVEAPTLAQTVTLTNTIESLLQGQFQGISIVPGTTFNLSVYRIFPHRLLQVGKDTSCYGTLLDDAWVRNLIIERMKGKIIILTKMVAALRDLLVALQSKVSLQRLGMVGRAAGSERACDGTVNLIIET